MYSAGYRRHPIFPENIWRKLPALLAPKSRDPYNLVMDFMLDTSALNRILDGQVGNELARFGGHLSAYSRSQLRQLEVENGKLKKLLAERDLFRERRDARDRSQKW